METGDYLLGAPEVESKKPRHTIFTSSFPLLVLLERNHRRCRFREKKVLHRTERNQTEKNFCSLLAYFLLHS